MHKKNKVRNHGYDQPKCGHKLCVRTALLRKPSGAFIVFRNRFGTYSTIHKRLHVNALSAWRTCAKVVAAFINARMASVTEVT